MVIIIVSTSETFISEACNVLVLIRYLRPILAPKDIRYYFGMKNARNRMRKNTNYVNLFIILLFLPINFFPRRNSSYKRDISIFIPLKKIYGLRITSK